MSTRLRVFLISFLIGGGVFSSLFIPKNSHHFAITLNEGINKNRAESFLSNRFNLTREFSEFSVYTFTSIKPISAVKNSLSHLGFVEVISTEQLRMLDILKKSYKEHTQK